MISLDPAICNITVSGRIASGTTTLAKGLEEKLGWKLFEGGELFEEFFDKEKRSDADRPDKVDLEFEKSIRKRLQNNTNQIIQSHLAGFDAQKIEGVFKILVICEDKSGKDMYEERAKRLAQRKKINREEAIREVKEREEGNLKKWRRLYAKGDQNWVYWEEKYYDAIVNTYILNQQKALQKTIDILTSHKKAL